MFLSFNTVHKLRHLIHTQRFMVHKFASVGQKFDHQKQREPAQSQTMQNKNSSEGKTFDKKQQYGQHQQGQNDYQELKDLVLSEQKADSNLTALDVFISNKDKVQKLIDRKSTNPKILFKILAEENQSHQSIQTSDKKFKILLDLIVQSVSKKSTFLGLATTLQESLKLDIRDVGFYEQILTLLVTTLETNQTVGISNEEQKVKNIAYHLLYLSEVKAKLAKDQSHILNKQFERIVNSCLEHLRTSDLSSSLQPYGSLSTICVGLKKLGYRHPKALDFVLTSLAKLVDNPDYKIQPFQAINILNFFVGAVLSSAEYGRLKEVGGKFVNSLEEILMTCDIQQFCQIVFAMGKIKLINYYKTITIVDRLTKDFDLFNLESLTTTLSGLENAKLYKFDPIVFKNLQEHADLGSRILETYHKAPEQQKQNFLPSLLNSLVQFEIITISELDTLLEQIMDPQGQQMLQSMLYSGLVQLMKTVMKFKMGEDTPFTKKQRQLYELVKSHIEKNMHTLGFSYCTLYLWVDTCSNIYDIEYQNRLLAQMQRSRSRDLNVQDAMQLAGILAAWRLEAPQQYDKLLQVVEVKEVQDIIRDFEKNKKELVFKTAYSDQVQELIKSSFKEEILSEIFIGNGTADLYLPKHNLIIEIDGARHYYQQTQNIKSSNLFKLRIWDKAGLNYLIIDSVKYYPNQQLQSEAIIEAVNKAIEESKLKQNAPDISNLNLVL